MTLPDRLIRAVGMLALWAGYGLGWSRRVGQAARSRLQPRRNWRSIRIGSLDVRVPADWGDLEPAPDGGFVIHNRSRRFRIDGDAVWYASAIELRIRREGMEGLPQMAPMTETCRTVQGMDGPVVLALAIANGVGPAKRREALSILKGTRVLRDGPPIEWPVRQGS